MIDPLKIDPSKKKSLGRGLSSLLGDDNVLDHPHKTVKDMDITRLAPGPYQPRSHFNEDELVELSASIKEHGVIQPLLVREESGGRYAIIAGERRWRAAKMAGLTSVPIIVKNVTPSQALELGLIENIQRQDLSPIEEAEGYKRLIEEFKHTQDALAKLLGKSRSHIANLMRLLTLPEDVKTFVADGQLSVGHAKMLVGTENPSALAEQIIADKMNVRSAEIFIKDTSEVKKAKAPRAAPFQDPELKIIADHITSRTGLKAQVVPTSQSAGRIVLTYTSLKDVDTFMASLA